MRVLSVRNAHQALPHAVRLLQQQGERRESRGGAVLVAPWPVTTVYERPLERVVFWAERDANPFFHLYEALWMLAGRNDLSPLLRYVKDFGKFSDDGNILHGAYGHRWRNSLGEDQLRTIAEILRTNPEDRRCVLQMWQGEFDLGREGKDVPCNTIATFQRDTTGALNLAVFCRSNDIIWGAYGANAVHFGFLLEYMAAAIGCEVGSYYQISVNWHAYATTIVPVQRLPEIAFDSIWSVPAQMADPYVEGTAVALPLWVGREADAVGDRQGRIDHEIDQLLLSLERGGDGYASERPFFRMAHGVLRAHHLWRTLAAPERYEQTLALLGEQDRQVDWVQAAITWVSRRRDAWESKMSNQAVQA